MKLKKILNKGEQVNERYKNKSMVRNALGNE